MARCSANAPQNLLKLITETFFNPQISHNTYNYYYPLYYIVFSIYPVFFLNIAED
jgi:hypothetical protein